MHRGCFVWTPTPPLSGRRTPRPGPVRVWVCVLSWRGRAGRPPGRVLVRLTFSCGRSCCSLCLLGPLRAGVALLVLFLWFFSPLVRPPCLRRSVFSGPGCLGPWRLVVLLPPLFCFFSPPPPACLFVRFVFFFWVFFFPPPLFFCAVLAVRCRAGVSWSVGRVGVCCCGPCASAEAVLRLCCVVRCPLPVVPLFVLLPVVMCVPVGAVLAVLLFPLLPCGVARPTPQAFGAGGFFFCVGLVLVDPPPSAAGCAVLCCGVSCIVWCGAAVCGVSSVVSVVVWRACVLAPCCAGLCCAVVAVLCFRALLRSLLVFFCVVPCLSVVLRAVSVSVLCLCGAVLLCLSGCSLCAALLPLRRWLVFCVVVCCVCVLAVGPGCPLLSPGGSWWLLVSCFSGVLWFVAGCPAAPCCCALCRPALCGFVLLCLVLSCGVSCRCSSSWGPVPSGAVFCRVSPRCVCFAVVLFAAVLCAVCVRRCRAVRSVSSPPCAVLPWGPALPWCPAPLCCAPWCCAAVWWCGVPSCCFVWFVCCLCLVSLT